jgi:flagellar protein FlaF
VQQRRKTLNFGAEACKHFPFGASECKRILVVIRIESSHIGLALLQLRPETDESMSNPYASTLERFETPRETEARLLRELSRSLESAEAERDFSRLAQAVTRNRSLWTKFATDLVHEGNRLPGELKARLLSIAGAVDRSCSEALAGDRDAIATLVTINRNIAAALA